MSRINEIRERMDKAAKGPWVYDSLRHTGDYCIYRLGAEEKNGYILPEGGIVGSSEWIWIDDFDGEFIAHAREDVEFLLNEIERLNNK